MKLSLVFLALLAGCASQQPMAGSYAFVLDPSVREYAAPLRSALQQKFPDADFIDVVLPADKHVAVVLVRRVGALPPMVFEYEIFRDGQSTRKGQTNVMPLSEAAKSVAADVARALRRG
jgi:hypothetical protein